LLNDISEEFIAENELLVFCGVCGGTFKQSTIKRHRYRNHEGKSLKISTFDLDGYTPKTGVDFYFLERMSPDNSFEKREYSEVKPVLKTAVSTLKSQNTLLNLIMCVLPPKFARIYHYS
jgi:hypothetical protein